jgi:hypothetical protein
MDESWNPEPPPEIANIDKTDLIEGTLFSKHSAFELLLKLIAKLNENDFAAAELVENDGRLDEINSKGPELYRELDEQLEKDMCDLWDMTVERTVCQFLNEYKSVQIFEGFLRKYSDFYPRAVEILVGILVNMVTLSEDVVLEIAENRSFVEFLLFDGFFKMTDVQSMIQVVSLMNVVFSAESSKPNEAQKRKKAMNIVIGYLTELLVADAAQFNMQKVSFLNEKLLTLGILNNVIVVERFWRK